MGRLKSKAQPSSEVVEAFRRAVEDYRGSEQMKWWLEKFYGPLVFEGKPIVVDWWQIPKEVRPPQVRPYETYSRHRIDPDGTITWVRTLIFEGYHDVPGKGRLGTRHGVGHVDVGPDGDDSEIPVDLDEVRRIVRDPKNWSVK